MWLITILLVILTSVLYGLHWYQSRSRFAKLLNAFPGPYLVPIIGNVLPYSTNPVKLFPQIRKTLAEYRETFRGWGGIYGSLHIVTSDDAEIILSSMKYIHKEQIYNLFEPWLSKGLLTSTGAKWQQRRKILTPAFHFSILQKFIEIFGEHSAHLVETLREECKKPKVDIVPLIKRSTLSSICETALGIKLNHQDEAQNKYYESLGNIGKFVIQRILSPWLYPDKIFKFTPYNWQFKNEIKFLHAFSKKLIKEREDNFEEIIEESKTPDEIDSITKKKRLAMLDLLITLKRKTKEIDDEGIREEVDTFIFEGHDTTASSLCFTLILLASHPEIQTKVRKELDEIFNNSDRPASYDDLQNMKYLERCLKESLRLYPSVHLITRTLTEDVQLTHHVAPVGTTVFVHIYNIHRDPNVFPDPEKFDPDRFLPENAKGRNSYAYIPFSAGPRNCIGQRYAMLQLKSIISSIIRNFIIEPVDKINDLTWIVDLVLRTKGSMNVKFIPRN